MTESLRDDPPEDVFTCPHCGMTSHHPDDAREGYCGNCHDWTLETMTILAQPVRTAKMITRGSVKLRATCGHLVWLANAGQAVLARGRNVEVKCLDCVPIERVPKNAILSRESLKELESLFGSDFRKHTEDYLRQQGFRP